jgi:hypothetical protein
VRSLWIGWILALAEVEMQGSDGDAARERRRRSTMFTLVILLFLGVLLMGPTVEEDSADGKDSSGSSPGASPTTPPSSVSSELAEDLQALDFGNFPRNVSAVWTGVWTMANANSTLNWSAHNLT